MWKVELLWSHHLGRSPEVPEDTQQILMMSIPGVLERQEVCHKWGKLERVVGGWNQIAEFISTTEGDILTLKVREKVKTDALCVKEERDKCEMPFLI